MIKNVSNEVIIMPLDPQVLEIYKSKPAPPEKYVLEEMRAGADATFNDKTEGHRNIRIRGQDYSPDTCP